MIKQVVFAATQQLIEEGNAFAGHLFGTLTTGEALAGVKFRKPGELGSRIVLGRNRRKAPAANGRTNERTGLP